jgi:hypothetical protein
MNPQAFNRYSYVQNNPIKYTDPSGHQGCESEPECESLTWQDIGDAVKNSVGDNIGHEIALQLVRGGIPTTVGYKFSVTVSADALLGVDWSVDITPAYNWYSNEAGVIVSDGLGGSVGTPQGLGINASGGLLIGQGATELDSFAGSSTIIYGSIAADEIVKIGIGGSYGWGVDENGQMFRDPESNTGDVSTNLGVTVGVNGIPNGVDGRIGISPGDKLNNYSRVINSAEDFGEFVNDVKESVDPYVPSGTCVLGQCFKFR